jgi:hypothetical protein
MFWLRSAACFREDSLPAAGPAPPDGIGYPQGFNERFHILEMILLSRASWRKAGHRARFASPDGNNGVKNALLIHLSFPLEIV